MAKTANVLARVEPDVTAQIDMLRQTNATLLIENLKIGHSGIEAISEILKGNISREDYQKMLKDKYKANGKH